MALKDWKKDARLSGIYSIVYINKNNNNEIWIDEITDVVNGPKFRINLRDAYKRKYIKLGNLLKKKSQALKFAKSYMRKH